MRAHLCGPVMHTQWLYGGQGADTSSWKACVCVCACACRLEGQLPPPSAHLGQWCCGGHGVQRLQLAPLPPVFAVRQHVCMRHTCKCVCVCACVHARLRLCTHWIQADRVCMGQACMWEGLCVRSMSVCVHACACARTGVRQIMCARATPLRAVGVLVGGA